MNPANVPQADPKASLFGVICLLVQVRAELLAVCCALDDFGLKAMAGTAADLQRKVAALQDAIDTEARS